MNKIKHFLFMKSPPTIFGFQGQEIGTRRHTAGVFCPTATQERDSRIEGEFMFVKKRSTCHFCPHTINCDLLDNCKHCIYYQHDIINMIMKQIHFALTVELFIATQVSQGVGDSTQQGVLLYENNELLLSSILSEHLKEHFHTYTMVTYQGSLYSHIYPLQSVNVMVMQFYW